MQPPFFPTMRRWFWIPWSTNRKQRRQSPQMSYVNDPPWEDKVTRLSGANQTYSSTGVFLLLTGRFLQSQQTPVSRFQTRSPAMKRNLPTYCYVCCLPALLFIGCLHSETIVKRLLDSLLLPAFCLSVSHCAQGLEVFSDNRKGLEEQW